MLIKDGTKKYKLKENKMDFKELLKDLQRIMDYLDDDDIEEAKELLESVINEITIKIINK